MALVLVVDDSARIRQMVRFSLERFGHRVLEAEDGPAAWSLLAAERPDLVLLDVMMPGPSGLDVCRKIRADPRLAGLPVVILTAGGGARDEADAMAAGASGFLTKPFLPSALLAMIESLTLR